MLFSESSEPWICGVTPGIVGAPFSGRLAPPLALNQSNRVRIATGGATSVPALASGLIAGPRYTNWKLCGLPAGDDESAMLFEIAATYFAKLAVSDHFCSPVGSNTMPARGLNALSCA